VKGGERVPPAARPQRWSARGNEPGDTGSIVYFARTDFSGVAIVTRLYNPSWSITNRTAALAMAAHDASADDLVV
jgi:hypothetical protein